MNQKNKISFIEILFNVLFFMVCIIFLFTIFFIFSPFSDANYFPVLSQYIDKYFWTIYSGPIVIAGLCFIKKRLFPNTKDQKLESTKLQSETVSQPEEVEMYKHDA